MGIFIMRHSNQVLISQLSLMTQEIEALQKNNWPRAIEIFDTHLEFANQLADQLIKELLRIS